VVVERIVHDVDSESERSADALVHGKLWMAWVEGGAHAWWGEGRMDAGSAGCGVTVECAVDGGQGELGTGGNIGRDVDAHDIVARVDLAVAVRDDECRRRAFSTKSPLTGVEGGSRLTWAWRRSLTSEWRPACQCAMMPNSLVHALNLAISLFRYSSSRFVRCCSGFSSIVSSSPALS
jgi:hypothetical protein